MSDGVTLSAIQGLPAPEIIETLAFETIYAGKMARAQAIFDAAGFDYTVGSLQTDPVALVLQAESYDELNLRARVNDGAKANLLALSWGSDLDHLAGHYDVLRLEGESDERLKERTALAIAGRSPGGTEERYKAIALGVSLDVAETEIYRTGLGPQLEMAVLANTGDGVPDQALLDAVSEAVNAKRALLVNDTIQVVSAVKTIVDVAVDAWMLPSGNAAVLDALGAQLIAAWKVAGGIGRDLNPSWITGRLFVDGVARLSVITPASPIVAAKNEAIAIQSATVSHRGVER